MNQKIRILTIGKVKSAWIATGIATYLKRLPGLKITEFKDSTLDKEATEILATVGVRDRLIVLSERGKTMDSVDFSQFIAREINEYSLVFAIGSSDGIAPKLEDAAHTLLALSPMTFTHDLARLLLIEQIYRAQNILQNGNYHK